MSGNQLKYKKDDVNVLLELVKVLYLQGDACRADKLLLEAQQLAPTHGEVKRLLGLYTARNGLSQLKKRHY